MINIFKRWFSHSKEQDIDDNQNPWAGLASYEDPETAERKLQFCGRDDDSYDLARLIMCNVFVTLYGKSGIGKTSLLNAGMFPELREEQYTPISIRLGMRDEERPQSYQTMIVEAIERVVKRSEVINVIDEQQDQQSLDYLWNYFARHRFYDKYDEQTTPVIVFDQFEEVFRGHRNEVEVLLRQLDYLNDKDHILDSSEVDGRPYLYEQNFRFVVSIREDDLYRLEDSIDNCYLPALKRCRYRLRSLSKEGARDAILNPGEGLFKSNEKETISEAIISKSRNDDGSISTNIISLLCSRIYVDFKKTGADTISPALVENFIKGNPFERFYNEATRGFSNKEKSYIEEHFVDSSSRRNSIPESDFLLHVKNGVKLLEGKNRILQRTSTSSDGRIYRIELIHDSFCEPLLLLKTRRLQRKRYYYIILTGIIMMLIGGIFSLIKNQKDHNWELMKAESRYIAAQAERLLDEGDSHMAQRLLLEGLPFNIESPNRPYVSETGSALWRAICSNSYIIDKDNSGGYLMFDPSGSSVLTISYDRNENRINQWNVETGKLLFSKRLSGKHINVDYSPNGNMIIVSCVGTCSILNAYNGIVLKEFPTMGNITKGFFTFDGKRVIIIEDSVLYIRNTQSFDTDFIYKQDSNICFAKEIGLGNDMLIVSEDGTLNIFNLNELKLIKKYVIKGSPETMNLEGKYLATQDNEYIRIYDIMAEKQICMLKGSGYKSVFNKDGKMFVYEVGDFEIGRKIAVWNLETKSEQTTLSVSGDVDSFVLSQDGKIVVTTSNNGIIEVWDTQTGLLVGFVEEKDCSLVDISPDNKVLISVSIHGVIKIWNLDRIINQTEEIQMPEECFPLYVLSPNGELLASNQDSIVKIWNIKNKKLVSTLKGHVSHINSISFSSDGHRIVTSSRDGSIIVWNLEDGKRLHLLKRKGEIRVWNPKSKKAITLFDNYSASVVDAVFSKNGKDVLSFSYDGIITKWNLETGKIQNEYEYADIANSFLENEFLGISNDGKVLSVSEQHGLNVWDSQTGKSICDLEGGTNEPLYASFSNDGSLVAVLSEEKKIQIWNAYTGEAIIAIDGTDVNYPIQLVKNGTQLYYRTKNDCISYKNIPDIQAIINKTRALFQDRRLTDKEKKIYYIK